jgi:hypothetical protein
MWTLSAIASVLVRGGQKGMWLDRRKKAIDGESEGEEAVPLVDKDVVASRCWKRQGIHILLDHSEGSSLGLEVWLKW